MRRKQAELQVYQDMAKLFDGQEDLLQEFSQFLPESFGVANVVAESVGGRKLSVTQFSGSDLIDFSLSGSQPNTRFSEGSILGSLNRSKQNPDSGFANHPLLNESKRLKRFTSNSNLSGINSKRSRSSVCDVSVVDTNQFTTGLGVTLLHKVGFF